MLIVSLWVGSLALSVILLRMAAWWWPPVTAIAALSLVYPLWSWLRLEATQGFLDDEFARFASERLPLLGTELRPAGSTSGVVDAVQRRIDLARAATQRLRSARQLLSNTIKSLPESVLLVDTAGRIALANSAAASLFGVADAAELEGTAIDDHLYAATQAQELRFAALATTARCTLETHFGSPQRDLLVRAVAFDAGETVRVGTILSLTDISEMRAAQRERDDLVRFLSHDMKSPATSLLGLAHLQRDPTTALPHAQFFERLDVLAHRVLTLVDSFVSLARAESADPTAFEIFDLHDALQDACDEVWAAAKARSIAIKTDWPGEALFVNGGRQLLARAIVNLLANAIKFSPTRSSVRVRGERQADEAFVTVSDQGPGIAAAKCATLFERFSRHAHQGTDDPGGTGLGLAFVRVVAEKHRGRVWVDTDSAQGAILVLALPVVTDLPDRSRARY